MKYDYPSDAKDKGCSISSVVLECKKCGLKFVFDRPRGDDLLKLVEIDGIKIKWLPTYGIGGYLDLEKKLAPQYNGVDKTDAVSMRVYETLKKNLPRYTEKGPLGNGFTMGGYQPVCPICKSKDFNEIDSKIINDPKLDWIKISVDLLKEDEE